MRSILLVIGVGVLLGISGLFVLFRFSPSDSHLATVSDLQLRCGISSSIPGLKDAEKLANAIWSVAVSDNEQGSAPKIRLSNRKVEVGSTETKACVLSVDVPPREPYQGIDWRLGHRIEDMSGIAGKKVKISIRLASDHEIMVPTGSVYSYDGKTVSATGLGAIKTTPTDFTWVLDIPENAEYLELWLRLTLHGAIEPGGDIYLLATALSEAN